MRPVPQTISDAWLSGDFTGENRPMARVTVQHSNVKITTLPHNAYASLPFGSDDLPKELPNVKSVKWSRSKDQDFASCTIELYNIAPLPLGETPTRDFDLPGYYTYNRGFSSYSNRWKQQPNDWAFMLMPDNVIRTYEGYGFDRDSIPEKDPHLVQTGVWRIDTVEYTAAGTINVSCRDIGSILGDQIIFPPVTPSNFYPLQFTGKKLNAGFNAPTVHTYTVDTSGKYDPKHPPPGGWVGPTTAPSVTSVVEGSGTLTVHWTPPANVSGYAVTGYRVVVDDIRLGTVYSAATRQATVTGLQNGNVYSIGVEARWQELSRGSGTAWKVSPNSHTIVSGDTLWALAQRYYGDPLQWRLIAKANGINSGDPMNYDVRHLRIGRVITIPGIKSNLPAPTSASSGNLRSEWSNVSTYTDEFSPNASGPDVTANTIVVNLDQSANGQPDWVSWAHNAGSNYASWRVIAYRNDNITEDAATRVRYLQGLLPHITGTSATDLQSIAQINQEINDIQASGLTRWPKRSQYIFATTSHNETTSHVDTRGILDDMTKWNFLVYGIADTSSFAWAQPKVGAGDPSPLIGKGGILLRTDGHPGYHFNPPKNGVPPHAPTAAAAGQPTVTNKNGSSIPLKSNPLPMTYRNSSNYPYIGVYGTVYGHSPLHAFDGSDSSYWLSIGNQRNDQGYSYEWIEGNLNNVELTHVTFKTANAPGGAYMVYVSVFARGSWVQHSGHDVIPYNEHLPESHNGADIPFCETFHEAKNDQGPHTVVFRTPIPGATRVRITFYNLQDFGLGQYRYRAGVRSFQAFGVSGTSNGAPLAGPAFDNDSPEIIQSYEVYTPPTITPGAGENPFFYEDYTDIIKLLCAWGGFFWPEQATIRLSDGTSQHYDFGTGPYGLENVDPVLGIQGSGRVWGDLEQTGTAGAITIPIDQWDKKSLMDGISSVRDIIGNLFFIDDTGGVVWRKPNWYALGNWIGDNASNVGRTDAMLTIDERQTLITLSTVLSGKNTRERVFVGNVDGSIAALSKGYNANPTGLRRIGGWTDMYFQSPAECQLMADLIVVQQMLSYRTDTLTISGNPAIQVDDQIRLSEQVTGEGNYVHYVNAVSSSIDLESGEYVYQLATNWLGERPFDMWAFNPGDLSPETQAYIKAITYTNVVNTSGQPGL